MADVCIKAANNCDNVLNNINVKPLKIDGNQIDLKCNKSSELSSDMFGVMLQLTENNMKELYEQSSWGWSQKEKMKEFQHKTAKFLILSYEDKVIAFCHFRFEHAGDKYEACVYCYELQVVDEYRRKGIGYYLMHILSLLAIRFQIYKVMLTVFKHNTIAMDFYMKILKFRIDKSSPSKYDQETDYEILSLKVRKLSTLK